MPKKKSAEDEKPTTPAAKLEAAVVKASGQEVVDAINEASPDDLKAKLVALAAHERETEASVLEDEELQETKKRAKEMEAPYKDTLKGINLQRRFIALRLEEAGKA